MHNNHLRSKRARDYGLINGILSTGQWNAITDVSGVKLGHATVLKGDNFRTVITVIILHTGNIFQEKVPAAVFVGNGFAKSMGTTQITVPVRLLKDISEWVLVPSAWDSKEALAVPRVSSDLNRENDDMSQLFLAVVEATEEAIYNSLFMATDQRGIMTI